VDSEFIDDVKRDVRRAAGALRTNQLGAAPQPKTCGACDYRKLCSSASP
jgi:DNA helicase-2/ATP-dependent DNA helicase PcrA